MPQSNKGIDPAVQNRLAEVAEELRGLLYGEAGCPEWGTKFVDIETLTYVYAAALPQVRQQNAIFQTSEVFSGRIST